MLKAKILHETFKMKSNQPQILSEFGFYMYLFACKVSGQTDLTQPSYDRKRVWVRQLYWWDNYLEMIVSSFNVF